ncbi:MAG: hypothetical protein Q8R60_03290 [Mycobacteriales bacterium]|nr:hypothetical protein [Mycobacteriales bacterium]
MPVPARSYLAGLAAGVALLVAGTPALPAAASTPTSWTAVGAPAPVVRLASGRAVPKAERRAMRALRASVDPSDPVTATFQTSYVGAWDSQQKAAFQKAVDVWSRLLVSSIPIVVRAELAVLDPGVLGSAGPANALYNSSTEAFYAVALANALAGEDLDPPGTSSTDPYDADVDIDATFADDDNLIYYGTDGNVPAGKYDFASTVMHELGHGLGFLGALTVQGDQGGYGSCDPAFDAPFIFDRSTVHVTSSTTRLLDYACGSTAMGTALRSGSVFWDGAKGVAAAGGTRPELFAPSTWQQGSSYSHLDETVYASGTLNSLMTPIGDAQEVNNEPGPIALGILADQGWQLSAAADPPVATRYTPLAPARVFDTRSGVGTTLARVGAGATRDLQVAGTNGVPSDATAVVLNVTGVAPSVATDIRVYPTPSAPSAAPTVSNLNLAKGLTRANLVTVKVGAGGKVRLRNNSGTVDLVADLAGFYSPGASSTYFPVSPVRTLDTRPGDTRGVAVAGKVAAGDVRDLQVAGVAGVPPSATAVVLGVTAANATASTDVRVFPLAGSASPEISNINAYRGGPTPNLVIVALGTDGKVRLRNNSGEVDLLADVYGYYDPSASGSLFRALTPDRVLDTRRNTVTKVSGPGSIDLVVAGAGGVGAGATAVVLNVTGTGPTRSTDVRVFPAPASGSAVPTVSTLNLVPGQTAADAAIVPVGSGSKVRFYNNSGAVALIADVAGWFGPA